MKSNLVKTLIEKYRASLKKKDERIAGLQKDLREKGEGVVVKLPVQLPDKLHIANFPEVQKVEVINHPESKDVQVVRVENLKTIESLLRTDKKTTTEKTKIDTGNSHITPIVLTAVASLSALWTRLWKMGITVKLDDEERLKPIPVFMVDFRGHPVALPQPQQVFMAGGGGRVLPAGPASTINSGSATVTTHGTRVQLSTTSLPGLTIFITAPASNGGNIYVGGTTVNAQSGQQSGVFIGPIGSMTLEIDDVSKVWIDSEQDTDKVTYTYIK